MAHAGHVLLSIMLLPLCVLLLSHYASAWAPVPGARSVTGRVHAPAGFSMKGRSASTLQARRGEAWDAPQQELPQTTLTLRHKETKCEVTLVGCVHGASASVEDVTNVIESRSPKVVVLELCESRYKHLVEEDKAKQAAGAGSEKEKRLSTAFSELKEFQSRYGILQTMLVALLSSSAEMQRMLSVERGCEFKTSIRLAEANKAKIVLGDQDLNVTLTRFKSGWRLEDPPTLLTELRSIRDAVVGPEGTASHQRLNLPRLLFTQERYIKEILRIVVPLSFIVIGALEAIDMVSAATLSPISTALPAVADSLVSGSSATITDAMTTMSWVGMHALTLLYLLGINKYILQERDFILAQSIKDACKNNPRTRVAAVVGLLHVNGVARHLREAGFE